MRIRPFASRVLGLALVSALSVTTVAVAMDPKLWWLLLGLLSGLWMYGFSVSHAYILAHDGIGPRVR